MFSYKVKYLASSYLNKASDWKAIGKFDGMTTSKELEALIVEESENGFELVSITPIPGTISAGVGWTTTTTGLIVTFKKIEVKT